LIDGIGIQGHYFEFKGTNYSYSLDTLRSNLNRIAAIGLPIYISEFDINEANDNTQLLNYQTYLPLFWEHPAVQGITLWGYVQNDIWKTNAYLIRADGSERPALPWLRIYLSTPAVISPLGLTNRPRNALLVWHRSAPATSYRVQVASDSIFSSLVADSTVTDTLVRLNPLAASTRFHWRVRSSNANGASAYSTPANFTTGDMIAAVEEPGTMPDAFALSQNYPNPFNPTTHIQFTIANRQLTILKVFDALGRDVATLVNEVKQPGTYNVQFDGSSLASGVYLCRLVAGNFVQTKRIVLLK
jgi:hypothetical protein